MWHWPNFSRAEVACRHCGEVLIHEPSMDALQQLRNSLGPIRLTSAYRCPVHNALVGGAPLSQHKFGRAFDIILDYDKDEIHRLAEQAGFTGFGLHYKTFIHVDTGPRRTW